MSRVYHYNRHELEQPGVYLAFDQFGGVLYIGSSKEPWARVAKHRANALTTSPWWAYVASVEIRTQRSLEYARQIETRWISMIGPPFNTIYRPRAGREPYRLKLDDRILRPSDLEQIQLVSAQNENLRSESQ